MYAARDLAERLSRQPAVEHPDPCRAHRRRDRLHHQLPGDQGGRPAGDHGRGPWTAAGAYPDPATGPGAVLNASRRDPALRKAGDPVHSPLRSSRRPSPRFRRPRCPTCSPSTAAFNWEKPHGQWMNQMLKDIDAAKAAGTPKPTRLSPSATPPGPTNTCAATTPRSLTPDPGRCARPSTSSSPCKSHRRHRLAGAGRRHLLPGADRMAPADRVAARRAGRGRALAGRDGEEAAAPLIRPRPESSPSPQPDL